MSILFKETMRKEILNSTQNESVLEDIKGAVRTISALKPITGEWSNSYFSPERIVREAGGDLDGMMDLFLSYNISAYKDFYKWIEVDADDNKVSIKKISLKEGVLKEFLSLNGISVSEETLNNLDHVTYWSKNQGMSMYFGGHWLNPDYTVYVGNQFYDWYDETIYYEDEEAEYIAENQKWFCDLYSAESYDKAVSSMSIDMDKIKEVIKKDIKSFEDFLNEKIGGEC